MNWAFGCSFRSRGERDYAVYLESEKQDGRIVKWKYEVCYRLVVNGKEVCQIYPDFTVWMPNDTVQIHEVKGGQLMMSPYWFLKKKLFEALHPHVEYRVIKTFQRKKPKKKWKTFQRGKMREIQM